MFMVPIKPNLDCACSFQTLSSISSFQKYKLDCWLLDQLKKMCLPPSLQLPALQTDLPKASMRHAGLREPGAPQQLSGGHPGCRLHAVWDEKGRKRSGMCVRLPAVNSSFGLPPLQQDPDPQRKPLREPKAGGGGISGSSILHSSPFTKTPSRTFVNLNSLSVKDVNLNMFGS